MAYLLHFPRLFPSNKRDREVATLLSGAFIFTILIMGMGWYFHEPAQNLPLLLSTLARAQAALFGIVFAITVLGIQLTTNRYSPRLVFLFIEGRPFQITFTVFVASIGLDILLLSQATATPSRILTAGVAAAGGLALAAAGILYWFVRSTLAQSTPEGLIDAIADQLSPAKYLPEVHKAERADDPHPLHRLYSLIMAALSRGESETAFRGLRTFDEVTISGLKHIQENEGEVEESELAIAFEPVQEEYLPEIALHAYENEERRTATHAVSTLGDLGQTGLAGDHLSITRSSSEGLSDIIYEPPVVSDANVLRNRAAETLGDLLKDSVPKSDYHTYQTLLHDLNHQLVVLLRRDAERWVYQGLIRDYMDGVLPDLIELLIQHYGVDVEDSEINWHSPHEPGTEPPSQAAERLIIYHRVLSEITESILQYTSRNEEYPMASGNFREAWKRITIEAAQSSLTSYAVFICQTLITTAYYVDQVEGNQIGSWGLPVANVMDKGNPSIVQQAFTDLEHGEHSNHKLVSIYLQPDEAEEEGFLTRMLNQQTTESRSFEDWLDQFQQQVQSRYEQLQ